MGVPAASDSKHQKNENPHTKTKTYCKVYSCDPLYQLGSKDIKLGTLWSLSPGHLNQEVTKNSEHVTLPSKVQISYLCKYKTTSHKYKPV